MTELAEIPITSTARRGLEEAGVVSLEDLAARSREEISAVHGVGAAALGVIERELDARGLAFDTAPARVEPVETVPARVEPVETVPARVEPVETAPARVELVETAPARVELVETAPARVEPVETAPARVELVETRTSTATAPEPLPGGNPLAIVALVLLLALPPASIVVGHIALGQIARAPQKGRELALVATILGYVFTGIAVLASLIGLALIVLAVVMTAGAIIAAIGGMGGVLLPMGLPGR